MDVRRVRFGERLRALREAANLTQKDVGRELGFSHVRVHRLETAESRPNVEMVGAILGLLGVKEPMYGDLLQTAEELSVGGWWREHRGAAPGQRTYAELESNVSAIFAFFGPFVPGLLQTEEYARYRIRADRARLGADQGRGKSNDGESSLAVRLGRQKILGSIDLDVVLDEVAIRRPSCPPAVMAEQLAHLAVERPRVTVRVLPLDSVVDDFLLPSNAFTMYRLPGGEEIAMADLLVSGPDLVESGEVAAYRFIYDRLRDAALSGEDSRQLLLDMAGGR